MQEDAVLCSGCRDVWVSVEFPVDTEACTLVQDDRLFVMTLRRGKVSKHARCFRSAQTLGSDETIGRPVHEGATLAGRRESSDTNLLVLHTFDLALRRGRGF